MKIRITILIISLLLFSTMYSCKSPQEKFFKKVQKYEALQSAKLNEMAPEFFNRLLPFTKEDNYLSKYGKHYSGNISGTASFLVSSNSIIVNYSALGYSAEERGALVNGTLENSCGVYDEKDVYYPLSYKARWKNISNAGSGNLGVCFQKQRNIIWYTIWGDGNWRHQVGYKVKDTTDFKNLIRQTMKEVESVKGAMGYIDQMCNAPYNEWEYIANINEDESENIIYPSSWHLSDNEVSSIIIAKRAKGMNWSSYSIAKQGGILSKYNYIEKAEEFIIMDSSIYNLEGDHVADCKKIVWNDFNDPPTPFAIIIEGNKENGWLSGYYNMPQ